MKRALWPRRTHWRFSSVPEDQRRHSCATTGQSEESPTPFSLQRSRHAGADGLPPGLLLNQHLSTRGNTHSLAGLQEPASGPFKRERAYVSVQTSNKECSIGLTLNLRGGDSGAHCGNHDYASHAE